MILRVNTSVLVFTIFIYSRAVSGQFENSLFQNARWQQGVNSQQLGGASSVGQFRAEDHVPIITSSVINFGENNNAQIPSLSELQQQQQQRRITTAPPAPYYLHGINYIISNYKPPANKDRRVWLNSERSDTLEWEVDWKSNTITFTISVLSNDYVALGLSKSGQVAGADIIVGGVRSNGDPYLVDMHGVDSRRIAQDRNKNWKLVSGHIPGRRVILKVSRNFDTRDEQDTAINNDSIHVLYDYDRQYPPNESSLPTEFNPQGDVQVKFLKNPVV